MKQLLYLRLWPLVVLLAIGSQASDQAGNSPPQVVTLHVTRPGGSQGIGNGFLVETGLILTAAHVVRDATTIRLEGVAPSLQVVAEDTDLDLALLSTDAAFRSSPAVMEPAGRLKAGQSLQIWSRQARPRPGGGDALLIIPAIFDGLSRAGDPAGSARRRLSLSASIVRGDSGSPVVRSDTRAVVGIVTRRTVPTPGDESQTAYAVPGEDAIAFLRRSLPRGATGRSEAARPRLAPADDYYLVPLARPRDRER